jgi:hypothetical protein
MNINRAAEELDAVTGDFIDGGVSALNNPALQALMTATMDRCGLNWQTGGDKPMVVSVGTGKANSAAGHANVVKATAARHAALSLKR